MKPETTSAALSVALRELAGRQAGVVSRRQLRELGIRRWNVRDQVRARRWRMVGQAVVLHRGVLTREQRWWVCVLHSGRGAALAGRTAATAAGLGGWDDGSVHVVVPRGARIRRLPGLVVHESRRWDCDASSRHRPPRTSLERAVVDAAAWSRHPRTAVAILAAAVQQRLTTAHRLRAALDAAGQVQHRRLLQACLDDIEGGSQALSEIDFVQLCRRAKLPPPTRQVRRVDQHGKVRYLDACWELPDGRVVTVEVDGAIHLMVQTYWDDMFRMNELGLSGDLVLRFPSIAFHIDDAQVMDQLRRALTGTCQTQRVS